MICFDCRHVEEEKVSQFQRKKSIAAKKLNERKTVFVLKVAMKLKLFSLPTRLPCEGYPLENADFPTGNSHIYTSFPIRLLVYHRKCDDKCLDIIDKIFCSLFWLEYCVSDNKKSSFIHSFIRQFLDHQKSCCLPSSRLTPFTIQKLFVLTTTSKNLNPESHFSSSMTQ